MLKVRSYEIKEPTIKDSFHRRSIQLKNEIIATLKTLGVNQDNITIDLETMPLKKAPASVSWYFEGHNLYYSYTLLSKYVENLYIVHKIIKLEVNKLLKKEISVDDFCREFSEDSDVKKQRIEARKTLGVESGEQDLGVISKKYKLLAKEHHPDMPNGDPEIFKKINIAHKVLKRELV